MAHMGRRGLMRTIALAGAGSMLGGETARAAVPVRWMWWGNPERDRRTNQAIRLYESTGDRKVTGESASWSDYWPKLATQLAGRRAPDVIQMDYRYLVEYARRGALLPMDDLAPDPLDFTGFEPAELDGGRVAGKVYGASVGANAYAVHWSRTAFERAGVAEPVSGWTWKEFEDAAAAITAAGPPGFYGAADGSRRDDVLERFLIQRGKALFTEDGNVGFSADDAAAFFAYWGGLRRRGVVTPAELTATDTRDIESSMLVTGKAAMAWHHSNQLPGVQGLTRDRIALATFPAAEAGKPSGNYLKPSQLMSINARAPDPKAAAALIRFVLAEPEAAGILGIERGVPESQALRDHLAPNLSPLDKAVADYVSLVARTAGPLPPAPPKGGGAINTLVPRVADKVAFGQANERDGGQELFDGVQALLRRA